MLQPKTSFNPLFIVGCPRSGTTLLATILDRHPEIAVTPETKFLTEFMKTHSWMNGSRDKVADMATAICDDPFLRDLGLYPDQIRNAYTHETVSWKYSFQCVLECYASMRGKSRPAEKTPDHLNMVPTLLEWFPAAKVVCIVRDGRDVILSMCRSTFPQGGFRSYRRLSLHWQRAAELCHRFEREYSSSFLRVHFETLVADPIREIHRIAEFADFVPHPCQLDPACPTGVIPDWEQDWKAKACTAIDASRAGDWAGKLTSRDLRTIDSVIGVQLEAMGYQRSLPETGTARVRMSDRIMNQMLEVAYSERLTEPRRALRSLLSKFGIWDAIQPIPPASRPPA